MSNKPVAWMTETDGVAYFSIMPVKRNAIPLYTHPVNPYQSITDTKIEPTVVSYTHPVKELTLNIGEIHAVWAAGKYYELDKDGQVDVIKFTEFAYAILRKAQE